MLKKAIKHFILITKHKLLVFKLCCKIGIPFRGFMHDWSKYSPTEFFESVKYYNGYAEAWLHHKGRNKHHPEYWVDDNSPNPTPIIPYKYVAEMICDKLAASIVYNGSNWTNRSELEYWEKEKQITKINKNVEEMLTEVFTQVAENGIDATLKKKNIQNLYKKHCNTK